MTIVGRVGAVHPRVSFSQLSTSPWTLEEDLAFFRETGITAIGVCAVKLEIAGWMVGAHRIADAELRVTNVIGLAPFPPSDDKGAGEQRRHALRTLEAARIVGAACLVVTAAPSTGASWDEVASGYVNAVEPIVTEAGQRNVPVVIEHVDRGGASFPLKLRDAVVVARHVGAGVCVDLHACQGERALSETIRTGADTFRLVQVRDLADSGRSDRLARLLDPLLDAGYGGVFNVELPRVAADRRAHADDCRRAIDHVGAVLDSLGV